MKATIKQVTCMNWFGDGFHYAR